MDKKQLKILIDRWTREEENYDYRYDDIENDTVLCVLLYRDFFNRYDYPQEQRKELIKLIEKEEWSQSKRIKTKHYSFKYLILDKEGEDGYWEMYYKTKKFIIKIERRQIFKYGEWIKGKYSIDFPKKKNKEFMSLELFTWSEEFKSNLTRKVVYEIFNKKDKELNDWIKLEKQKIKENDKKLEQKYNEYWNKKGSK